MTLSDRLARKVVLITGAGAGIGRASALRFAAEGATVIAVDRDAAAAEETAQRVRAAGGLAEAEAADVAEPMAGRLLFGTIAARHPRPGVLFNNDGTRCTCLCPGPVDTPSGRRRVAASPDPDAALQDMIARQPMGRVGTPEEIAALAAYLVSDEAAYTTGTAVFIDGGLSL